VWLAYDLDGSYEEGPPTLIDAAKRDRRWCQGNLQHSWLLAAKGFFPVNRIHLFCGVMSYLSSPLWFLFLVVSSLNVFQISRLGDEVSPYYAYLFERELYGMPQSLFLFLLVMVMIFVPKFAAMAIALRDKAVANSFGGPVRLVASTVLECVVSALLAPVQMMFHTKFVVFTLLGQGVNWIAQNRSAEDGTDWREAILTHWWMTVFGLVWGASAWAVSPTFFWWLSPVLLGLVLAAPISIVLSKAQLGQALRSAGLLMVPEEVSPPFELARLNKNLSEAHHRLRSIEPLRRDYGLLQAVLDPYVNSVHVSLLRQRRNPSEEKQEYLERLRTKLLAEGPGGLSLRDKQALLLDAESMLTLHRELWRTPSHKLASWWQLAMRQYNVLTQQPATALYR
jgi:membrane glycosyltransferase